jgi:hypothetical protein
VDNTLTDKSAVLGDRLSIKEMAKQFEETYGEKPGLKNLGTLEELKANLDDAMKQNIQNIYGWMGL